MNASEDDCNGLQVGDGFKSLTSKCGTSQRLFNGCGPIVTDRVWQLFDHSLISIIFRSHPLQSPFDGIHSNHLPLTSITIVFHVLPFQSASTRISCNRPVASTSTIFHSRSLNIVLCLLASRSAPARIVFRPWR